MYSIWCDSGKDFTLGYSIILRLENVYLHLVLNEMLDRFNLFIGNVMILILCGKVCGWGSTWGSHVQVNQASLIFRFVWRLRAAAVKGSGIWMIPAVNKNHSWRPGWPLVRNL